LALRSRSAGRGSKPPRAASVKSRGGERRGKGAPPVRQVRAKKANASEPPMKCRNVSDDAKTEVCLYPREKSGGNLLIVPTASGIEVARAWLRLCCGTWEPVVSNATLGLGEHPARPSKGEPQVAETARGRVPTRDAGSGCSIVARKPGNAGGAKRADCSGPFGGQPPRGGRSR
jgi:hypothetical protein